jgi:hypothetical protein
MALDKVNYVQEYIQAEEPAQKLSEPRPLTLVHLIGYFEHDPKAAALRTYHRSHRPEPTEAVRWFNFL